MQRENRRRLRRQVRYPAHVDLGDGTPMRPCTLSDVSELGARLTIEGAKTLPREFALLLSSDGGAQRWCQVAWQSETQVGVLFSTLSTSAKHRGSARLVQILDA